MDITSEAQEHSVTLEDVIQQLSPEGRLHWENAVLKAQIAQIQAGKPEEVGQIEE